MKWHLLDSIVTDWLAQRLYVIDDYRSSASYFRGIDDYPKERLEWKYRVGEELAIDVSTDRGDSVVLLTRTDRAS